MPASDRPQYGHPPLVISAGLPDDEYDVPSGQLLEIEEALLSLTRAALAQGRPLVLPSDPEVAPLVAEIAAEYAEGLQTEAIDTPEPRVYILLTEGWDVQLAEALSGSHDVRLAPVGELREERRGRQRLTEEAVRSYAPAAAVVLGGARESLDDFELLRQFKIPLHVIGTTLAGPLSERPDLREYDAVEPALREIGWGWGETDITPDAERFVPYPYVMQQLIAQLGPTG